MSWKWTALAALAAHRWCYQSCCLLLGCESRHHPNSRVENLPEFYWGGGTLKRLLGPWGSYTMNGSIFLRDWVTSFQPGLNLTLLNLSGEEKIVQCEFSSLSFPSYSTLTTWPLLFPSGICSLTVDRAVNYNKTFYDILRLWYLVRHSSTRDKVTFPSKATDIWKWHIQKEAPQAPMVLLVSLPKDLKEQWGLSLCIF